MQSNQRKIGAVLSFVTTAVNAVVGFLYVPLLLRYMGKNEYGLYQLMGSIIALLSVMDFGLSATVTRYYSKYKTLEDEDNMENVLALSGLVYILITIVLLIVGIGVYFNLGLLFTKSLTSDQLVSAKKIFIVFLLYLGITIPSKVFDSVITSHEKFVFIRVLTLVQIVTQPVFVIAVMNKWPTALAMVIVQTIFSMIVILVKAYYCFYKISMKIKLHHFNKSLFTEMMQFSFFIFLGAILDQLFWQSNQIVLGMFINTAAVAVYGVATTISNSYMSLSTAITSVFLPRITSLVTHKVSDKEISDLFIKIGRVQFLILACVLSGFIIYGRQFINVWAGSGFSNTYIVTLILIIPFTIDLIQNIGLTILQAKNKLAYRSVVFLIIAIINVIASIPLTIYFGVIGCALAAGVSFFVGNAIVMNIYYYKVTHIDIKLFWKEMLTIAAPTLGCALIGVGLNYAIAGTSFTNLAIKCFLYLGLYIIAMWKFSMNTYEKDLINSILYKLNLLKLKKEEV